MKFMKLSQNPENIVAQLEQLVNSNKHAEIRLNANGGNSILVLCPPLEEANFIAVFEKSLCKDTYQIINLNDLLISFMDDNKEDMVELFELLSSSIYQIFKASEEEETIDFFSFIMNTIHKSIEQGKVPVIVRTGTLYGSGIDSIHLMENQTVMRSPVPLIILYPAKREGENILFLSTRPASKYRCMILN